MNKKYVQYNFLNYKTLDNYIKNVGAFFLSSFLLLWSMRFRSLHWAWCSGGVAPSTEIGPTAFHLSPCPGKSSPPE